MNTSPLALGKLFLVLSSGRCQQGTSACTLRERSFPEQSCYVFHVLKYPTNVSLIEDPLAPTIKQEKLEFQELWVLLLGMQPTVAQFISHVIPLCTGIVVLTDSSCLLPPI